MADKQKFKMFSTNRLSFSELYQDVMAHIRNVYNTNGREFTIASPFAQIVTVILNLSRMVFYYIEDSITELNIKTAFRERSVRGLATLTGHMPSMGIAARGSVYMSYNMTGKYEGSKIILKNYTKIVNAGNNLIYSIVLPSAEMPITVGAHDSKIELQLIQGEVRYQQSTGNGEALQSFNFTTRQEQLLDNFFINVYVNGERWTPVVSLLDMAYDQKSCVIRPSIDGGVDVFFGTGLNGAVPPLGSSVLIEYIETNGPLGNITELADANYWAFSDTAYTEDGEAVNLNEIYNLSYASQMLFGTAGENIEITRKLAPHMSRSFVLANADNYKYFLSRLNIFSKIDAFSGFGTENDMKLEDTYSTARNEYYTAKEAYFAEVNRTGAESAASKELYEKFTECSLALEIAKNNLEDSQLDDNTVYLYLVPDISKRIQSNENYFTCPKDVFVLTEEEKNGIINLIESSGQQIITVENKIIDPVFVKFAINIFIQMWDGYELAAVKSAIIGDISQYLISSTRRDRIPVSDLVTIVENVPGVDSVTIYFDADKNNALYYGADNYGIDEYGDIILERKMFDTVGSEIIVTDLMPMFRGPFTNIDGVEYEDGIDSLSSVINVTLRGRSEKTI